jgi:hypothetical protein
MESKMNEIFKTLEFIVSSDSPEESAFFSKLFKEMIYLLGRPFGEETFDFAE